MLEGGLRGAVGSSLEAGSNEKIMKNPTLQEPYYIPWNPGGCPSHSPALTRGSMGAQASVQRPLHQSLQEWPPRNGALVTPPPAGTQRSTHRQSPSPALRGNASSSQSTTPRHSSLSQDVFTSTPCPCQALEARNMPFPSTHTISTQHEHRSPQRMR